MVILAVSFLGEKYSFENPDWDIPVLTGALKLFFRELMEPLVPFKHFEPFLTGFSEYTLRALIAGQHSKLRELESSRVFWGAILMNFFLLVYYIFILLTCLVASGFCLTRCCLLPLSPLHRIVLSSCTGCMFRNKNYLDFKCMK